MRTSFLRGWVLGLLASTAWSSSAGDALAVPAPPDALTVTQPDGTPIHLTLIGDETNLRAEDARGYSALGVATDAGTEWRYAVPGVNGLVPGPLVVGRDDPSLLGLPPHLTWPREVTARRALRSSRGAPPGPPSAWLHPRAGASAPRRHQRPLVALVAFTGGHPPGMPLKTYTPAQFAALLFARDLDPVAAGLPASYTASVADYFDEVSRGQWVFAAGEEDVIGWVDVPRDYAWYVAGAHGMGPDPRNADTLVVEVASAIDDLVDFSAYDLDADGRVDNLILVVEGWSDGSLDQFWPFTAHAPPGILHDGVELSTYVVVPEQLALAQPEYGLVQGDIHPIGTLCHELGHVLGLPDLADPDGSSSGVGIWSLMGAGAWRSQHHPTALDAWSRMMLGWELPVELDTGPLAIEALTLGGQAARIWVDPYRDAEYFLVENRLPLGTDRHLPTGGLLIWHIDEARRAALDFRDVNADERHPVVALEQADGLGDLRQGDGTGDSGDPFPGRTGKRDFGAATVPDSRAHDGTDSGVRVLGISNAREVMTADVTAPERWGYRLSYDVDARRRAGLGDNTVAVRFTAPPAGDGIAHALIVWAEQPGISYEASLRVRNIDDRPGRVLWTTTGVLSDVGWNRVPITTHLPLSADESIFGVVRYGSDDDAPLRFDDGPNEAERSLLSANGTSWQVAPGNAALRLLVDQCPDFDGDGTRACKGDCDDQRAQTHPTALEICNGVDDDCGGDVDEGFADLDEDDVADCVDPDDDGDGVDDDADVAPRDPTRCQDEDGDGCDDCALARDPPRPDEDGDDLDGDGLCDSGDQDVDGDGLDDDVDPAPLDPMRCGDADADTCDDCAALGRFAPMDDGPDADADGTCDASDDDDDGDGVPDAEDVAPLDALRCTDSDGDGCDDCSVTAGPPDPADDGVDNDGDGVCDIGDDDDDGDTIPDAQDLAPGDRLRCADADGDGCDDCAVTGGPPDPASDGVDTDGDGLCDAGDDDDDDDGVPDAEDGAALDPARCADVDDDGCDDCAMRRGAPDPDDDGPDTDGDGTCDASDDDDDGDGAVDVADRDPLDPFVCGDWDDDGCDDCSVTGGPPDGEHDGTDVDRDGICDAFDSDLPRPVEPTPRVDGGCGTGGGDASVALGLLLVGIIMARGSRRRPRPCA